MPIKRATPQSGRLRQLSDEMSALADYMDTTDDKSKAVEAKVEVVLKRLRRECDAADTSRDVKGRDGITDADWAEGEG